MWSLMNELSDGGSPSYWDTFFLWSVQLRDFNVVNMGCVINVYIVALQVVHVYISKSVYSRL